MRPRDVTWRAARATVTRVRSTKDMGCEWDIISVSRTAVFKWTCCFRSAWVISPSYKCMGPSATHCHPRFRSVSVIFPPNCLSFCRWEKKEVKHLVRHLTFSSWWHATARASLFFCTPMRPGSLCQELLARRNGISFRRDTIHIPCCLRRRTRRADAAVVEQQGSTSQTCGPRYFTRHTTLADALQYYLEN